MGKIVRVTDEAFFVDPFEFESGVVLKYDPRVANQTLNPIWESPAYVEEESDHNEDRERVDDR